jgi:hypothetical protein
MLYLYVIIINKKPTDMATLIETAEIINKEFAGCYATVEGRKITVTYRGKKSDKIFIENAEVTKIGGFQVAAVAGQIAERFNLIKNL